MNQTTVKAPLLSIQEAAEKLNMPVSRIRYEVFLKRIPHLKIGRSIRFNESDLEVWIENKKVGGQT